MPRLLPDSYDTWRTASPPDDDDAPQRRCPYSRDPEFDDESDDPHGRWADFIY